MQREQLQTIAFGAGLMAVIIAIATGRLPRWLRVTLIFGLVILACGGGLYAYRYYNYPTTLTVAAGSVDGAAPQLMSAIAARLTATSAPVRLKVIDKGTVSEAIKAFSSGEVDLAVVRPDVGDLSAAENVVVITRGVVLIVTPPGSSIMEMDDLQGKTVGVVGGEANQKVVEALTREYGLDGAKTHFKEVAVPDIAQAFKSKQISALLVVMPLSQKYLTMLRNVFQRTGKSKPGLSRLNRPARSQPSQSIIKAMICLKGPCRDRHQSPTTI